MDILNKNQQGLTKQQRLQKREMEKETKRRIEEFQERLPDFRKEYFALTRKYKIDFFITYGFHPSKGMFGTIVPADISVLVEAEEKARVDKEVVVPEKDGIVN